MMVCREGQGECKPWTVTSSGESDFRRQTLKGLSHSQGPDTGVFRQYGSPQACKTRQGVENEDGQEDGQRLRRSERVKVRKMVSKLAGKE